MVFLNTANVNCSFLNGYAIFHKFFLLILFSQDFLAPYVNLKKSLLRITSWPKAPTQLCEKS